MVVSWTLRALELHQAGLRRSAFAIACQDFDDSAEMIWRVGFMYDDLRDRFPKWELPKMRQWRGGGPQRLTAVELQNGSSFSPLTGRDPNTFRQKGVTGVSLEECAHFVHLASVYANAATMCKGQPGSKSGLLTLISTVNGANKEWMRLSKP
jgi:hypothetical protein